MTPTGFSSSTRLGALCAETVLRRIDALALVSSNRHVVDYLPREAALATFEALLERARDRVLIPIPSDGGHDGSVELAALGLAGC